MNQIEKAALSQPLQHDPYPICDPRCYASDDDCLQRRHKEIFLCHLASHEPEQCECRECGKNRPCELIAGADIHEDRAYERQKRYHADYYESHECGERRLECRQCMASFAFFYALRSPGEIIGCRHREPVRKDIGHAQDQDYDWRKVRAVYASYDGECRDYPIRRPIYSGRNVLCNY